MSRLRLDPMMKRTTQSKKSRNNLGNMILFCEGTTEYNYFYHFAKIINDNRNKYSHMVIEFQNTGGNAQRVLNFANDFLETGNNASIYRDYEKFLVFDCDAPDNIQEVINEMKESDKEYQLLLTNLLIETWLMMHFENVDQRHTKTNTYKKLRDALGIPKWGKKEKANSGYIRQIIENGDSVISAIENAKRLEKMYLDKGYNISKDIEKMNPYTSVHTLVEEIYLEIFK